MEAGLTGALARGAADLRGSWARSEFVHTARECVIWRTGFGASYRWVVVHCWDLGCPSVPGVLAEPRRCPDAHAHPPDRPRSPHACVQPC